MDPDFRLKCLELALKHASNSVPTVDVIKAASMFEEYCRGGLKSDTEPTA